MSEHFKTICERCEKVIEQCRCSGDKEIYYDVCENCKIEESKHGDSEPDDMYNDIPVFDVSSSEFYNNMRQERNRMRFKNGSKVSRFMQNNKYRKPFYMRHTDNNGEKYMKKVK